MKTNKIVDKIHFSYQPIVNVYSGNTVGVEAYLRGYNNLGFNNVPQFFDNIKNEKNYIEIECEIIRKAIKGFEKASFSKNIILFININDELINNNEFNFGDVIKIITNEGLFLENVCFDIDGGKNKHFVKTFDILKNYSRDSGFKLSIDNYGIYSINYPLLSQDSPNFIKIDRDLVSNVNNIRCGTFLQYITKIAHLFGINIIAECVETKEEYFMIKQYGIDMLQGYFVAKPTKDIESIDLTYKSVEIAAKHDRRRATTDEDLIRDRLDKVEPVLISSTMEEVFERFEDNPELSILPVIDNARHPLGVICEKSIKRYIYAPFGRELLINKSINENLRRFLTAIPTVDIKKSIEEVIEVYSQNIDAEGLIVTEDAKYKGMLNPKDIINIINKKELEIAKETNPLTKLPGNILINKYISDALNNTNKYRYFVYLDFNHFKPFNDNYGFRLGDRAILMCKDILFKSIDTNKYFIGHIGGDDFFVGSLSDNEECLSIARDVEKVISSFNNSILVFFDEETRKKGYYIGINRQGRKDKINLLSISAAIIEIAKNVNNINEDVLSNVLAKSKKIAKRSPNNLAVVGINSNLFSVASELS